MFAICLESSHSKGMGHFFRMLNFANYLNEKNEKFIFFINKHDKAINILEDKKFSYEIVNLNDFHTNWEKGLIDKYNILYWINDRLETTYKHSQNVIESNVKLITFDDLGEGAEHSDLNICGLVFTRERLRGRRVLKGVDYLILNPEITKYKKERTTLNNILVTLGGSDTYGVTIKILRILKKYKIKSTLHIGPSFQHTKELYEELNENYKVIDSVPSIIKEFSKYDLAITGGGITPFEANASGLPCLIVANEIFEIPNALYLEKISTSVFIGFHEEIDKSLFSSLDNINLNELSIKGLNSFSLNSLDKIYMEIIKL